jgi:SsrA-binding protein
VPLRIYFNKRGIAKIELALARGKRQYDKRRAITERQQKKDIDRDTKRYK